MVGRYEESCDWLCPEPNQSKQAGWFLFYGRIDGNIFLIDPPKEFRNFSSSLEQELRSIK